MQNFNDPSYLKQAQYRSAENLEARIRLHKQFSTNPHGVYRWFFDHALAHIPQKASILEVGSGSGELWASCKDRVPAGWDITLSDFAIGILNDAKKKLAGVPFEPEYREIDVQSIPYPDESFDAVFANFMLYHVPDRDKAIAEIRRVLKPNGVVLSATLGNDHMREYNQVVYKVLFDSDFQTSIIHDQFSIENGEAQLRKSFGQVEFINYDDHLRVTEVEPMVDYFLSLALPMITSVHVEQFAETVRSIISNAGHFFIQKHTGMFIGRGYAGK
jgi:ubiquinone/menaquinone biosynthesis C-methylase UbiE